MNSGTSDRLVDEDCRCCCAMEYNSLSLKDRPQYEQSNLPVLTCTGNRLLARALSSSPASAAMPSECEQRATMLARGAE